MSAPVTAVRAVLSLVVGVAVSMTVLELFDGRDERADVAGWADPRPAEPGDRVLEAVAGLADDRVHVTVDGRSMLDEEGEAAVAAAIAERDLPVHVVVWRFSRDAGYDHTIQAAEQIVAELDEPAHVVLWEGTEGGHGETTEGWTFTTSTGDGGWVEDEPEFLGDAEKRLLEWIEQVPDDPLESRD
ncbi:hypothetical protein [Nocardioides solisilvae]|uniref:hypothetical protein n=1 Tax=Nocardioides solisilvae TaxID=1542435 RepID=UPI000D7468F8|nr:hypothetical protein [Nocardioides solisilvae]